MCVNYNYILIDNAALSCELADGSASPFIETSTIIAAASLNAKFVKIELGISKANLPSVQNGFAVQPTPFVDLPRIGDKLNFAEFSIRFLISEDMVNYIELLEWLIALGFPDQGTPRHGVPPRYRTACSTEVHFY